MDFTACLLLVSSVPSEAKHMALITPHTDRFDHMLEHPREYW